MFVATKTAAISVFLFFLTGNLSFLNSLLQNTKFVNNPYFGIKTALKILKTSQKNELKIYEFKTHQ